MVYYKNLNSDSVEKLLLPYGLQLHCVELEAEIPHSFWGTPEAGRKKNRLYISGDTPLHSVLHEACHYICMPAEQRTEPHVDAKGSAMEENATCYLQILLSDHIDGYDRGQLMQDMDEWGYSFRMGSAHAWFTQDVKEVREWLQKHQIIDINNQVTLNLRKD